MHLHIVKVSLSQMWGAKAHHVGNLPYAISLHDIVAVNVVWCAHHHLPVEIDLKS
jgi:hypothetical protein